MNKKKYLPKERGYLEKDFATIIKGVHDNIVQQNIAYQEFDYTDECIDDNFEPK